MTLKSNFCRKEQPANQQKQQKRSEPEIPPYNFRDALTGEYAVSAAGTQIFSVYLIKK